MRDVARGLCVIKVDHCLLARVDLDEDFYRPWLLVCAHCLMDFLVFKYSPKSQKLSMLFLLCLFF